jgi:hypothetical protein
VRRSSPVLALLAAAIAAAAVAGCTSNSPNPGPSATDGQSTTPGTSGSSTSPPTRSATTPQSTTSTPADPRVAAALKAYESFVTAYQVSQQHPPAAPNKPYVAAGNFPKYSFDPARAETVSSILFLTEGNLKYEGTAPTHRVSVTNANLGAAPHPTVTVTDCPTAPASWKVVATTGPPPTTKTPKVPPPYKVTAQVIFYEQHWGVSTLKVDDSNTCSP